MLLLYVTVKRIPVDYNQLFATVVSRPSNWKKKITLFNNHFYKKYHCICLFKLAINKYYLLIWTVTCKEFMGEIFDIKLLFVA